MKDKIVWITGASSGIGEFLAYAFSKNGAKVILSARRRSELERVGRQCSTAESDVFILPLDMEIPDSFNGAVQEVLQKYGRIDVLVNNAGISQRSLVRDTPISVDKRLMDVNYIGTVALTKAVLPAMLRQNGGQFVVITSAVGKFGSPWRSGYSASKHALHGFFDAMRAELYNDNIRVLLVCPGFVRTDVSLNALDAEGNALNQMDNATEKGLSPESLANQVLNAIRKNKQEVVIGGVKEKFGVWMKRHFPSIFSVMIRKMSVR